MLVGEVPDPGRAVAEHDAARDEIDASALEFAQHALGEERRHAVGVPRGNALDGAIARAGAGIAARRPVLVAPLGRPDGHQLHFPCLGGTVGLLADASRRLGLAHRHAGAVQSDIERLRRGRLGIDHLKFVAGDIPTERLGMAFHLLGADLKTGQLAQRGAGMAEAHLAGRDAHHAPHPRRERGVLKTKRPVARTEPAAAGRAVIPRPLKRHRTQHRREGLRPAVDIGRVRAAAAGRGPPCVAPVGVEAIGHHPTHDAERGVPARPLQRFEVDAAQRAIADQARDLGHHLRRQPRPERGVERPLFPGSARRRAARRRSQSASLTSISSRVSARRRWHSSTWRRVSSTAETGTARLCILPLMSREIDHCGPWPGWPSAAQWQFGLPHLRWRDFSDPGRRSPMAAMASRRSCRRASRATKSDSGIVRPG